MDRLSIVSFLVFVSFVAIGQDCQLQHHVYETLTQHHYRPRALNDSLSADIFRNFIEQLDPDQSVFSRADVARLSHLRYAIDDDIKGQECSVYEEVGNAFVGKLSSIITHLKSLTSDILKDYHVLQFTIPDPFQRDRNIFDQINIRVKSKFLYHKLMENDSAATPDQELFAEVKERVLCKYQRLMEPEGGIKKKILSCYLNAIALAFDPHSIYLNAIDKARWDFGLDTEVLGFGFLVRRNMIGQLEVSEIIPGSAAWDGEIKKGGILKGLQADDTDLDLTCMEPEEINYLLLQSPYQSVVLKLEESGQMRKVELKRRKMEQYANVLQTFLLEGERKIAYVAIPAFYSSLEDTRYVKGLSDDLAKQLVSLKMEGIEGLIIDLRSNGGGSLAEAIKLLGLFISEGPLFTMENAKKEMTVVKDLYRGVAYRGPLLVMVNKASASAAEVFAGAIQEWGRGVIAGSATFGKSTSQITIPVADDTSEHFLNVTTEVMQRIDGSSHQGYGVLPDIHLTDILTPLVPGENERLNYLRLEPHTPLALNRQFLPLQELQERSRKRISLKKEFAAIQAVSGSLEKGRRFTLRLDAENYMKDMTALETWIERLENMERCSHQDFSVNIPEFAAFDISLDEVIRRQYKNSQQYLTKDLYLWESYHILSDLITLTSHE